MSYEFKICGVCNQDIMDFPYYDKQRKIYVHGAGCPNKPMETIEPIEDIINKPTHYHKGGIDVIGYAEQKFTKEELRGFFRINVLKYVTRYEQKGGIADLDKASFYINKLKELEAS